jgi:hypothetical protein
VKRSSQEPELYGDSRVPGGVGQGILLIHSA